MEKVIITLDKNKNNIATIKRIKTKVEKVESGGNVIIQLL